jgi:hypothetical protein
MNPELTKDEYGMFSLNNLTTQQVGALRFLLAQAFNMDGEHPYMDDVYNAIHFGPDSADTLGVSFRWARANVDAIREVVAP